MRFAVALACFMVACSSTGGDPVASPPPSAGTPLPATSMLPDESIPTSSLAESSTTGVSSTAASSTAASSGTTPPATEAPVATTSAPRPLGELFGADPVAWSLPPRFGAAGTAMPITVEVTLDGTAIESIDSVEIVVDGGTTPSTTLTPATGRFWTGEIPAALVVGEQLTVRSVAHTGDGSTIESSVVTIPLLASTGATLRRVDVDATETLVHAADGAELGIEYPEFEGAVIVPASVAAVSATELAVADTVNRRVVCFDLTGATTCDVALPRWPDGDLVSLGDGTLALVDFENLDGAQAVALYRIDPAANTAEPIFEESPLQVDGFAGIAHNSIFTLDAATGTAWIGVPEYPEPGDVPDPDRFLWADAFHLSTAVTRGPTVARPALRPDVTGGSVSVVDGGAWASFDGIGGTAGTVSVLASAITPAGAVVMLVGWTDDSGSVAGVVRWMPGESTFEFAPVDYEDLSGSGTRVVDVLDDDRIVVLDQGARVRVITLRTP